MVSQHCITFWSKVAYIPKLLAPGEFIWILNWKIMSHENVLTCNFDTSNKMFRVLLSATLLEEHDTQPSIILATLPKNLRHSTSWMCTQSKSKVFFFLGMTLFTHIWTLVRFLTIYSPSLWLWVSVDSTLLLCMMKLRLKLGMFQHVQYTHSVYRCPVTILITNTEIIKSLQATQAGIWSEKLFALKKQIY